ncbi:dihydrolipoamide acetyltransferase family protein [Halorientalis salina]|uniref:dihydrolipoamide acetyltransferase family protein n=1 Tax=Halorientalis salina TaxID=2932266 RepID=UPI0010AC2BB4|nr:dihydrolipoamide acetyltransferase family protein [Halorientalis salina]
MPVEFKLPDVGEGVAEGEIVQWLVEPGDTVSEDQPVAEVETDKAVVEVPSPVNGTVKELRAEAGEVVPVGEVIIVFETDGEEPSDVDVGPEATDDEAEPEADDEASDAGGRVFAAPSARRLARELGIDIGTVEGSGPGGRVTEQDVRTAAESPDETPDEPAEPAAGGETGGASDASEAEGASSAVETTGAGDAVETDPGGGRRGAGGTEPAGRDRTLATPATRKAATEAGVDIDDVPATERRDGEAFVTPEAVREYAEAQQAAQAADAERIAAAGREESGVAAGEEERLPYRGVRRAIGDQMERSAYTAPHVTHHDSVDVTELVEARAELKERAEERGISLSYLPFVVKAVVAALEEFPILNSQLDEENEQIVTKGYYNVGIATATDAGLMVPVIDDADRKSLLQVASEANELAQKARDRSIAREEMQGGTFTITNFGAIGGEYATPIINYPETAILGLGAIKERPWVVDGEVEARHVMTLSLSIDHRVIDGAEAARFTNTLKEYLANPTLLLLE